MNNILGAIIGDYCGSTYEWDNETDYDSIDLFRHGSRPTDDSVLTCAIAEWIVDSEKGTNNQKEILIKNLKSYTKSFPHAGYGGRFKAWALSDDKEPIDSWGNGSAMRVSACGFVADTYDEAKELAKMSAEVTHSHPEGIKGAQAVATAIFLAKSGFEKDVIKQRISDDFGYDLNRKVEELKNKHKFTSRSEVTVPEAIIAFLDSNDFEDAIKLAISIGGDSDTIAAIAGSIAGVYYGIPTYIADTVIKKMPKQLWESMIKLNNYIINSYKDER